jgi:hypothetical protein
VSISDSGQKGMESAEAISSSLLDAGVPNSIASVHSDESRVYVTFKLRKNKLNVMSTLEAIKALHPDAVINFHGA